MLEVINVLLIIIEVDFYSKGFFCFNHLFLHDHTEAILMS